MPKEHCFSTRLALRSTRIPRLAAWLEVLRPHGVENDMNLYKSKPLDKHNEEAVRDLLLDLPVGGTRVARNCVEEWFLRAADEARGPTQGHESHGSA